MNALTEPATGWQPIVTAPEGDDPIHLLDASDGRQVIAQRLTSANDGSQAWIYARTWIDDVGQVAFAFSSPTHWKPLVGLPS